MLFSEITAFYYQNHMKHTNTLFGQNAEFEYIKEGRTYSNHCALKG
jgi:hypothetical protein